MTSTRAALSLIAATASSRLAVSSIVRRFWGGLFSVIVAIGPSMR
jgi:hypothetical protein